MLRFSVRCKADKDKADKDKSGKASEKPATVSAPPVVNNVLDIFDPFAGDAPKTVRRVFASSP
jgi:hypothetical protein